MDEITMEGMMTNDETAATLRIRPHTLENWRSTGRGPQYYKIKRQVRYKRADVEAYGKDYLKGKFFQAEESKKIESANPIKKKS